MDFSKVSRIALPYALAFARESGACVTLLHVVPTKNSASAGADDLELEEELRRGGATQLSALIQALAGNEVSADMLVRIGNPTVETVHAAKELKADLIIISTHGRTGLRHLLLGSVAEGVMRHSPCPVLVVRKREHGFLTFGGHAELPYPFLQIKSILVPIDFSAPSKNALIYAAPFAQQFGAKLILLHVVERGARSDLVKAFPLMMKNDKIMAACQGRLEHIIAEQAIDPKLVETTLVRQGRSFREIVDTARTLKADLIIISTHGYTGLKRALLGSTTKGVMRHAPCPMLVVREREREFV